MSDFSIVVKRGVTTLLTLTITSVLGYLINKGIQLLLQNSEKFIPRNVLSAMNQYEKEIASQVVEASDIKETLDSIGGLTVLKEDIRSQVLIPLKYPHIFFGNNASLHPNKGLLLCGPPGVGKTMIARAIAAEANVPFIALTLSTLENKYFGETSKLLQAAFSLAQRIQPCILFFDEIDGMVRTRNSSDQSCVYSFKTELLTHMDGLKSKKNDAIFLVGCTNAYSSLDPALQRRMSKVYHLDLPTLEERFEILKILTKHEIGISHAFLKNMATLTQNFSGSDLSTLYRETSGIRLTEQTRSNKFLSNLKLATSPEDMEPHIIKLSEKHWNDALQRLQKSKKSMPSPREDVQINTASSTEQASPNIYERNTGKTTRDNQALLEESDEDEAPPE